MPTGKTTNVIVMNFFPNTIIYMVLKDVQVFQVLRPPDFDGIKIFDKDEQAPKHCFLF